jgi:hypothetical protein
LRQPEQEEGDGQDGEDRDVRIRLAAPELIIVGGRVLLDDEVLSGGDQVGEVGCRVGLAVRIRRRIARVGIQDGQLAGAFDPGRGGRGQDKRNFRQIVLAARLLLEGRQLKHERLLHVGQLAPEQR